MVAHSLWERGAVGSNPATPTDVTKVNHRGETAPVHKRGHRLA